MPLPAIVTFTGLAPSVALYSAAVEHAQLLDRFADEICCCEVSFRANAKHCCDGSRILVQAKVALVSRGTRTEYGIAPNAKGKQASLVLRQMLLVLAQRADDGASSRRSADKSQASYFPVP